MRVNLLGTFGLTLSLMACANGETEPVESAEMRSVASTDASRTVLEAELENTSYGSVVLGVGDLNGDTYLDFIEGNFGSANAVMLGDNTGSFTEHGSDGFASDTTETMGLALADFDSDGDLDVVVCQHNVNSQVWTNSGSGSFTLSATLSSSSSCKGVSVGDVTGDGHVDLIQIRAATLICLWVYQLQRSAHGHSTVSDYPFDPFTRIV